VPKRCLRNQSKSGDFDENPRSSYLRNPRPQRRIFPIQRRQPCAHARAEIFDLDPTVGSWECVEPPQCSAQQRCGADEILALKMMKGCRNLNQRLQKRFLRLLALQPDAFPMLMREKILSALVAFQPFRQCSAAPVK
jgi:hypothetical protein